MLDASISEVKISHVRVVEESQGTANGCYILQKS